MTPPPSMSTFTVLFPLHLRRAVRTRTRKSEPIDCLVLDFRPPVDGYAAAPGLKARDEASRVVREPDAGSSEVGDEAIFALQESILTVSCPVRQDNAKTLACKVARERKSALSGQADLDAGQGRQQRLDFRRAHQAEGGGQRVGARRL